MSDTIDIANMANPSFVLHAVENVSFEDRPVPELTSEHDDVIVEIKKTGICGSDVHFYAHGGIGPVVVKEPMVLGHESSGIVSKVGSKVKNVKLGDRVAVEPGPSCGQSISGADIFGEHLTPSSSSAQPSRPKPIPVSENLRKLKACLAATAPAANLSNSKVASPAPATASSTSTCAPTQSALPSSHPMPIPSTPSVSAPPQPAVSSSPAPQIQMDATVDTTMDTNQSVHPVPPPIGPANHPAQGQWQAGPGFQYPPMFPHHPVQQPQQFQGPVITHPPSQNQPYLGQGQYGVQVQPGFVQLPPGVTPEILTGLMQLMGANGWGGGGMGGAGNNPNAGGGHQ
ncbi:hypothetical protein PQX77_015309 [Marasmius sp. AFHP31]|nr:hypothetical protein PQX77_015309 [Marasmius sp. AFHP31]